MEYETITKEQIESIVKTGKIKPIEEETNEKEEEKPKNKKAKTLTEEEK